MKTISTLLYDLPEAVGERLAWLGPLLARVALGWVFLQTGWGKLHALEQITEYFASLGIPYPALQAPLVASVELVCGAMILVGLFTRLAALPLVGTMIVATATAQWPNVESLAGFLGLIEVVYAIGFVWLALAGPGPVSLDAIVRAWLRRSSDERSTPLASASRSTRSALLG